MKIGDKVLNRRQRPLGGWKDMVRKYMCERGASGGRARRRCLGRKRWCHGQLLRGQTQGGGEVSETDRE